MSEHPSSQAAGAKRLHSDIDHEGPEYGLHAVAHANALLHIAKNDVHGFQNAVAICRDQGYVLRECALLLECEDEATEETNRARRAKLAEITGTSGDALKITPATRERFITHMRENYGIGHHGIHIGLPQRSPKETPHPAGNYFCPVTGARIEAAGMSENVELDTSKRAHRDLALKHERQPEALLVNGRLEHVRKAK